MNNDISYSADADDETEDDVEERYCIDIII